MALDEGAVLVQVSRELFMRFIAAKPRTLQIYLHKVRPDCFAKLRGLVQKLRAPEQNRSIHCFRMMKT